MMHLIPEPGAIMSSPHQHPEKSSPSVLCHTKSRRRYCSSDEEDDSRDRQSHWKRLKTRPDDQHRGTLIRYTERDRERSPPRSVAPSRTNSRPGHKGIVLKGKEQDSGLRRCRSGSQAWDMPDDMLLRWGDGGSASSSQAIYPMRENESMMDSSRSFSIMSERIMVEYIARRASTEKGYEVRVSGREALGEGPSFEDSHSHADDAYIVIPARMGVSAAWKHGGRAVETMNRGSSRGFSDHQSKAPLRARRVDFDLSGDNNGKARTDEGQEHGEGIGNHTAAAAAGIEAKERDMESERRQEKRERWAEKERDLEKELEKENSLPRTQNKAGVTFVDYSHKFTVAKAPIIAAAKPIEVDPHRLCQRQKQIDYGKNTLGYERYTVSVPRYLRTKAHPRTPDIRQVCSKRSWDGQIRKWRRLLHEYDPPKGEDEEDPDLMFAPTWDPERSATENSPMNMQSEFGEDPDLKIYDEWSDDER